MPSIKIERVEGEEESVTMARSFVDPSVMAGVTIDGFIGDSSDGLELNSLIEVLNAQVAEVKKGNTSELESILTAQTVTLNAIFNSLALKASQAQHMDHLQAYMKLALKSQAQSRATLEAISSIMNPSPTTFVKQANISQGHQQVNNLTENDSVKNELLESEQHGEWLDGRTTIKAVSSNQTMAAVETINRP